MKMSTLYAALSGALLLGTAALAPAQNMTTTTTDSKTSAPSSAVHSARDKVDTATSGGEKGISRDEYKREKDRIEADAKAAKAKCKGMKGNEKDICQAEAKANEKIAKKELDYKNKPTEKNRYEAEKMKIEGAYEVAKEKCEDQKGAEMASCKKQAKADKDQKVAALKGDRKTMASTEKPAKTKTTTDTSAAPSGSATSTGKSGK